MMRQFIYYSSMAISTLYATASLASDYCDELFRIYNVNVVDINLSGLPNFTMPKKIVDIKLSDLHTFTMPKNTHVGKSGHTYYGQFTNLSSDILARLDQIMRDGGSEEVCYAELGNSLSLRDIDKEYVTQVEKSKHGRKRIEKSTTLCFTVTQLDVLINLSIPSRNLKIQGLGLTMIRCMKDTPNYAFDFVRPITFVPGNTNVNDIKEEHHDKAQAQSIPSDFNADDYLKINADVLAAQQKSGKNAEEYAREHYVKHGMKEGRSYSYTRLPADFNADAYLNINGDVRAAQQNSGKTPEQFAREHYINHGKNEGRRYK